MNKQEPLKNAALIVFAGLPGSGKSSIARPLAQRLALTTLRLDALAESMLRAGIDGAQPIGLAEYVIAETVAETALTAGASIIVDGVNAVEPARQMWRDLAAKTNSALCFVEVVCPDEAEHRSRFEHRDTEFTLLGPPNWAHVQQRKTEYEPWNGERLQIDSTKPIEESLAVIIAYLNQALQSQTKSNCSKMVKCRPGMDPGR